MRVILRHIAPDEMTLAVRAARWLIERPEQKDAILAYGEQEPTVGFYVRRNKASISVLRCIRSAP